MLLEQSIAIIGLSWHNDELNDRSMRINVIVIFYYKSNYVIRTSSNNTQFPYSNQKDSFLSTLSCSLANMHQSSIPAPKMAPSIATVHSLSIVALSKTKTLVSSQYCYGSL